MPQNKKDNLTIEGLSSLLVENTPTDESDEKWADQVEKLQSRIEKLEDQKREHLFWFIFVFCFYSLMLICCFAKTWSAPFLFLVFVLPVLGMAAEILGQENAIKWIRFLKKIIVAFANKNSSDSV